MNYIQDETYGENFENFIKMWDIDHYCPDFKFICHRNAKEEVYEIISSLSKFLLANIDDRFNYTNIVPDFQIFSVEAI